MSNRSLIDQYIDAAAAAKAADAVAEDLKKKVVKEFDIGTHEGTEQNVQVFLSQRSVMDFDKLLRLYGITEEQFKLFSACKKDGAEFSVVKVINKKA
jgi:hypothetical protein